MRCTVRRYQVSRFPRAVSDIRLPEAAPSPSRVIQKERLLCLGIQRDVSVQFGTEITQRLPLLEILMCAEITQFREYFHCKLAFPFRLH